MENRISLTAYYTLGVRAWDAARSRPICGDDLAEALMDDQARELWRRFQRFYRANVGNATRHRLIDDLLREALRSDPAARVVIIGAGFDTRAFRLQGGSWIEIDEPPIVALKEARLPAASAPNPLVRAPVAFARESMRDVLGRFAGPEQTHVVLEGVLVYLTHAQRAALIDALQAAFPRHVLYCDLVRRSFFRRYVRAIHREIRELGASFVDIVEAPEELFLNSGYEAAGSTSVPLRLAESGLVVFPAFFVRWFLRTARRGFTVWKFRYGEPASASGPTREAEPSASHQAEQ